MLEIARRPLGRRTERRPLTLPLELKLYRRRRAPAACCSPGRVQDRTRSESSGTQARRVHLFEGCIRLHEMQRDVDTRQNDRLVTGPLAHTRYIPRYIGYVAKGGFRDIRKDFFLRKT